MSKLIVNKDGSPIAISGKALTNPNKDSIKK